VIFTDLMPHIHQSWFTATKEGMGVGAIGLISGSVVELIARTVLSIPELGKTI
jgi:hypothetical protein